MKNSALKLVERAPTYRREVELQVEYGEPHSLHQVIPYPESFSAEVPAYFISKFSPSGGVVLDPFCGSGATALQSALSGRIACASDSNPLALRVAAAKISPADLTEVTLFLQQINLKRPVDIKLYRQGFCAFYDVDTFRELCNLRSYLQECEDRGTNSRVSGFVELVALSLLHGHSAGYFSVYSFPQIAASPAEQEQLNLKRGQSPDYRAVLPRILRKTASSLRDGWSSSSTQYQKQHRIALADARDLHYVPSGSVDLIVTAPPLPGSRDYFEQMWLRFWFARLPFSATTQQLRRADNGFHTNELERWGEALNASLLEMARVLKHSARCVLELREVRVEDRLVSLDDEVARLVQEQLGRYFEIEGVLVNKQRFARLENSLKARESSGADRSARLLILRRR